MYQLPTNWSNQHLVLYHGTTQLHVPSVLQEVDLAHSKSRLDFGPGFYTTTFQGQAETWARNRVRELHDDPAVIAFIVPRDGIAILQYLAFVRGAPSAQDFWSFVSHCRIWPLAGGNHERLANEGWYDIVIGPVTRLWRERSVLDGFDQMSFHTERSLELLNSSRKRQVL